MSEPLDVPSTKQELERKTLDVLSDLAHRLETGRISNELATERAHTVWNLVSGLVSSDITALAERVTNEVRTKCDSRELHLWRYDCGEVIRIRYSVELPDFVVQHYTPGSVAPHTERVEVEPGDERKKKIAALYQALLKTGFQRL